jgi:guanine deaminase
MSRRSVDEDFAAEAVRIALDNAAAGQLPFGALVVKDGEVLATGVNSAVADHDPTAHAELAAVRAACRRLQSLWLNGATLVSSCEPCAMCHAAALITGVERILYAAHKEEVPDLGVPFPRTVAEMGDVWRSVGTDRIEHVPTPGSGEPFARFAAASKGLR